MKKSPAANVQYLLDVYGEVDSKCDHTIAEGIGSVHAWIRLNPSASLESNKFPLLHKIREWIDTPFTAFASHHGLPNFCFSRELLLRREYLTEYLEIIYEELAESFDRENPWVGHLRLEEGDPNVTQTINALVDFVYLCTAMVGPTETVVVMERRTSGLVFTKVTGKRTQRARGKLPKGIPAHRYFEDRRLHLCHLCSSMTEHLAERIENIDEIACQPAIASDAMLALKEGARLATPQFSTRYCTVHSPQQGGAVAYKRALRRREMYHAMRRLLINVRQTRTAPVNIIADRAAAFAIVDSCPVQGLLDDVPKLVDAYRASRLGSPERTTCSIDVLEKLQQLYASFEQIKHPLSRLVKAYYEGAEGTYLLAVELGVIPRSVDDNLAEVWPMFTDLVKNRNGSSFCLMV